jgi:hypothetical protein
MERDRFLEHDFKQKTNELISDAPVSYHERHEAGFNIRDSDVRPFNSSIWRVALQNKCKIVDSLIYYVEKIGDSCNSDFCYQRCLELSCLGLCSHNYHLVDYVNTLIRNIHS